MPNEKQKISLFQVLTFGFRFHLRMFPISFIAINLVGIFYGVICGITTFVTEYFFDSVSDTLTGVGTAEAAYRMVAVVGLTLITREVLSGVDKFMHGYISDKSRGALAQFIHSKMARIAPVSLENTDLLDDINRATEGVATIYPIVSTAMRIFTFFIPYFIVMGFYLHYLKPQFVIALVMVFVPVLVAQLLYTGIIAKFEDIVAPIRREHGFYHQSFTGRMYYKDTRILGAARYFAKEYLVRLHRMNKARVKVTLQRNALELIAGLLSVGGYAGILFMLMRALLDGTITVGAFAAVFASIDMLFGMMRDMVQNNIGQMMADIGKAHNFIRFLDMPEPKGEEGTPDYSKGIVAKQISFRYPNADHKSVDGASLTINAGETIAIVGENGAGKTTLVRLLTGLYTPTEGTVTINGMDTQKTKAAAIFRGISGVFQKFQRYQMTLKENIHISDIDNAADTHLAIEQAGIDINSNTFPEGLDTTLSREFDGVDLSGGQWQRIAIARGLYRIHNVIVLDEPTAAIDPIEESRIYNKFIEISKGKTAIIVTHRLGSTKIADRVVFMNKGKIADVGSHYELIQKQGLYAEMFKSQAWWYDAF